MILMDTATSMDLNLSSTYPVLQKVDDGSYVAVLPNAVTLLFLKVPPSRKGAAIKYRVVAEKKGYLPELVESKEPPWMGTKEWNNAPGRLLYVAPSDWDTFRWAIREAMNQEKVDKERKIAEEEAAIREARETRQKEREQKRLEKEAKNEELDKYYLEHPDEMRPEEPPEAHNEFDEDLDWHERPSYYGICPKDMGIWEFHNDDSRFVGSPTKAAKAILEKVPLCKRNCDKDTTYVRNESKLTWSKYGKLEIESTVDTVLEDASTTKLQQEIFRRVSNALRRREKEITVNFEGPEYHGLVGLQDNLVLNLWTGEVRPLRVEDHMLDFNIIPVRYNKIAKCPCIDAFLKSTLGNDNAIRTMLDIFVALLDRRPWRAILIMVGKGMNGKSVMKKLMVAFVGLDTTLPLDLEQATEGRFALANVLDKRFVILTEAYSKKFEGRKVAIRTNKLKAISGDDNVPGEKKNVQEHINFIPFSLCGVDTNDPPLFDDNTPAWISRMRPVTFPFTFVAEEEKDPDNPLQKVKDDNIIAKLTTEEELSGLLNRIIERAPELMKTRTVFRDEAAMEMFRGQVEPLREFFDRFVIKLVPEKGVIVNSKPVSTTRLLEKFKAYCDILNVKAPSDRTFYNYLGKVAEPRSSENITIGIGEAAVRLKGYTNLQFDEFAYDFMEQQNKIYAEEYLQ